MPAKADWGWIVLLLSSRFDPMDPLIPPTSSSIPFLRAPAQKPEILERVEEGQDTPYPDILNGEGVAEGPPKRRKRNTARLVWEGKPKKAPNPKNLGFQIAEVVVPNPAGQAGPRLPFDPSTQEVDTKACNRLIWGDNLLVMQALLAQGYEGKLNLIYIDPPFDSKADYSHSVQLTPSEEGMRGELNAEMSALERLAYRDTWEDGTDSYLDMLYPRLHLMHRLLAEDGAIVVHCDWHLAHHIRTLLDEVFGRAMFRNHIVWVYGTSARGAKAISGQFARNHDDIFYFSKSAASPFYGDVLERSYSVEDAKKAGFQQDAVGNWFKTAPRGDYTDESIARLEAEGRIHRTRTGGVRIKYPLPSRGGLVIEQLPVGNAWTDISDAMHMEDGEVAGYETQKPEKLLGRIIRSLTKPGDLVADFFCGSGTAAAVAEKLGRRWITSDLGKAAIQVARNRFVKMGESGSGGLAFHRPDGATRCSPFVVENLGNYQRQLLYLHDTRLRQVGSLILTLYGAQPHPTERGLGIQGFNDPETGRFQRRLVLVADPDRPLSAKRVAETIKILGNLDGGSYSRLVALGWDFELNFDTALDKHLGADWRKVVEVRQIPTEVIEYLKKIPADAGPDDPAVERLRAQVTFFEKPFLAPPALNVLGWTAEMEPRLRVSLTLTRYTLRGLPMGLQGKKLSEEEARTLIQKAGGPGGLNLIDFWSVDDDLGGEDGRRPFTSTWQALRGVGKRVRPVATEMELMYAPRPGRRAALRLVDLFGNDAIWTGFLPDADDARRAGV